MSKKCLYAQRVYLSFKINVAEKVFNNCPDIMPPKEPGIYLCQFDPPCSTIVKKACVYTNNNVWLAQPWKLIKTFDNAKKPLENPLHYIFENSFIHFLISQFSSILFL